jgi:hypothetical protein
MNRLTQLEVDNFVAAIKREPFNRPRFINTHRKLITCSGIRPDGVCDDMRIPRLLSEWPCVGFAVCRDAPEGKRCGVAYVLGVNGRYDA